MERRYKSDLDICSDFRIISICFADASNPRERIRSAITGIGIHHAVKKSLTVESSALLRRLSIAVSIDESVEKLGFPGSAAGMTWFRFLVVIKKCLVSKCNYKLPILQTSCGKNVDDLWKCKSPGFRCGRGLVVSCYLVPISAVLRVEHQPGFTRIG